MSFAFQQYSFDLHMDVGIYDFMHMTKRTNSHALNIRKGVAGVVFRKYVVICQWITVFVVKE